MSKIDKIELSETVDYSTNILDIFYRENDISNLEDYREILHKISNAQEKILIASTSEIYREIIEEIYKNKKVHKYVILKNFDNTKNTLNSFNKKEPLVTREVKELENNFIIIDKVSYLLFNNFGAKENIAHKLDENLTKDLDRVFAYYFWNCASKEKLVNKIAAPKESPFPPFYVKENEFAYLKEDELFDIQEVIIPKDKKYEEYLERDSSEYFILEELEKPVSILKDSFQIGRLIIKDKLKLNNKWRLTKLPLDQINESFIPKNDKWELTEIQEFTTKPLEDLQAEIIEMMENTEPKSFPELKYTKKVEFIWNVLPPIKPKDASNASIYIEYENLQKNYLAQIADIKSNIEYVVEQSSTFSRLLGANRKATKDLEKVKDWSQKELFKFRKQELEDFLSEFRKFMEDSKKANKDFKRDKKELEEREKWEKKKEELNRTLGKKQNELKEIDFKLTKLDSKKKEYSRLSKDKRRLQESIMSLECEIEDNKEFNFEYKENELSHAKAVQKKKYLSAPEFSLPEVGELFETHKGFYLEIENFEDLELANSLKERYGKEKEYFVVAKALDGN